MIWKDVVWPVVFLGCLALTPTKTAQCPDATARIEHSLTAVRELQKALHELDRSLQGHGMTPALAGDRFRCDLLLADLPAELRRSLLLWFHSLELSMGNDRTYEQERYASHRLYRLLKWHSHVLRVSRRQVEEAN